MPTLEQQNFRRQIEVLRKDRKLEKSALHGITYGIFSMKTAPVVKCKTACSTKFSGAKRL